MRHSCASLLLANGVPFKHIQEWLGHSDFTTTANIYAHLDYKSKITSAQAMETGLALPGGAGFRIPPTAKNNIHPRMGMDVVWRSGWDSNPRYRCRYT